MTQLDIIQLPIRESRSTRQPEEDPMVIAMLSILSFVIFKWAFLKLVETVTTEEVRRRQGLARGRRYETAESGRARLHS